MSTSRVDLYHTPEHVARKLLAAIRSAPAVVADFAAGHGNLLRVAREKWPDAKIIGTDRSKSVYKVKGTIPDALIGLCDFLNPASRARCNALATSKLRVSVAVLNPPFSCRGAKTVLTKLAGVDVRCSVSLAFVVNSFPYLQDGGEVVAVLPAATVYAEKDRAAWLTIREHAEYRILGWNGNRTFNDCFPRTVMVYLKLRPLRRATKLSGSRSINIPSGFVREAADAQDPRRATARIIKLFRGKQPMFSAPTTSGHSFLPLVHSTELRNNSVNLKSRRTKSNLDTISAPAVLISRVGAPMQEKVAVLKQGRVVLSDCVIALCCSSGIEANDLSALLLKQWRDFESSYSGTGARYITIQRLAKWLHRHGYDVIAHPAGSRQLARAIAEASSL